MAQPNVAREPSMEEILASIRRIIESNEPGQGVDFPADANYSDDPALDSASETRSPPAHVPAPANQAFGQRQVPERASFQPQAAPAEPVSEKSMSLADVAARVRAAADRNAAAAVSAARAPEPIAPAPSFTPSAQNSASPSFYGEQGARTVRPTDNRPLLSQAAPAPREEVQQRIQESTERMVEAPATNWNDVSIRTTAAQTPAQPQVADVNPVVSAPLRNAGIDIDAPKPVAEESSRAGNSLSPISANLLSELAEQEIARSFDELQTLFSDEASPNVEEMTRDMLRPMLQEWLEDNLPTIVERLVREEINRVVRGPKR